MPCLLLAAGLTERCDEGSNIRWGEEPAAVEVELVELTDERLAEAARGKPRVRRNGAQLLPLALACPSSWGHAAHASLSLGTFLLVYLERVGMDESLPAGVAASELRARAFSSHSSPEDFHQS